MTFKETKGRSIVKSITFRILVMLADAVIIYLITGSYQIALSVIIFSNISSTIIFFFHERAWDRINWGREKDHSRKRS